MNKVFCMKVLNIIWAFSTGGIGKCFLTYDSLDKVDKNLDIYSVCIDIQNCKYDREPLINRGISRIIIKNKLDFSWISSLGKIANDYKPDVIFCHGFNGPIITQIVKLFYSTFKVPMVCTYHGKYNPPTNYKRLLSYFINWFQTFLYKHAADKIILVSEYSGNYLLKSRVPKNKMVVVYNGIEDIFTKKTVDLPDDIIKIGLAARIDEIKGINYLLDAIKVVKSKSTRKFHLYIVGDGPLLEQQKKQIVQMGIDDVVSYLGYQNNVLEWLNSWDIFCLPSLQENHSIALLEAMRAGKAIICTNVGGNPETVINNKEAILVSSKDVNSLANAILNLINDEQKRLMLGNNAYNRYISEFTEDIMKNKLVKVLNSIKNND